MSKRTVYTKTCEQCGREYTTQNKHQRFCSYKCRGESQHKRKKFVCETCGKEFEVDEHDLRWRPNEPKYCSRECYHKATRKRETRTCPVCGKEFECTPKARKRYCSLECYNREKRERNRVPTQAKNGYKYVWFADGSGKPEHRYVMENHLGRKLMPTEHVHHIDGSRNNNDINNLEVLTKGEHSRKHRIAEVEAGKPLFGREL